MPVHWAQATLRCHLLEVPYRLPSLGQSELKSRGGVGRTKRPEHRHLYLVREVRHTFNTDVLKIKME